MLMARGRQRIATLRVKKASGISRIQPHPLEIILLRTAEPFAKKQALGGQKLNPKKALMPRETMIIPW
jgi:hypothetical protein